MLNQVNNCELKITDQMIKEILDSALSAPTGDNCQHWNFKYSQNNIEIHYNHQRGQHTLNDNLTAALISLGTVVETISIASSSHGIKTYEDYHLSDLSNSLWVTIALEISDKLDPHELSEYIPKRETNRNHYKRVPLSKELINKLNIQVKKYNTTIFCSSNISSALRSYLMKCDLYIFRNKSAFKDTSKWVRFNKKEIYQSRDGFGLKNLCLNPLDGIFIKILKTIPTLLPFAYNLGLKIKLQFSSFRAFRNTGSFILFTSKKDDNLSIVNTGRAALLTWLVLTKNNNGVQPLTISTMLPLDLKKFKSLRGCPKDYINSFSRADQLLRKSFNTHSDDTAIWLFRTGPVQRLTKSERTLRRDQNYLN